MKGSRYTELQIITVLKEVGAGMKVEEVCRQQCYLLHMELKYCGIEAFEVKRLKELEEKRDCVSILVGAG